MNRPLPTIQWDANEKRKIFPSQHPPRPSTHHTKERWVAFAEASWDFFFGKAGEHARVPKFQLGILHEPGARAAGATKFPAKGRHAWGQQEEPFHRKPFHQPFQRSAVNIQRKSWIRSCGCANLQPCIIDGILLIHIRCDDDKDRFGKLSIMRPPVSTK